MNTSYNVMVRKPRDVENTDEGGKNKSSGPWPWWGGKTDLQSTPLHSQEAPRLLKLETRKGKRRHLDADKKWRDLGREEKGWQGGEGNTHHFNAEFSKPSDSWNVIFFLVSIIRFHYFFVFKFCGVNTLIDSYWSHSCNSKCGLVYTCAHVHAHTHTQTHLTLYSLIAIYLLEFLFRKNCVDSISKEGLDILL